MKQLGWLLVILGTLMLAEMATADDLKVTLRSQRESATRSGKFESTVRNETWLASQTAFIVCDVWDAHHCLNAVRRLEEFAPRMNDVLKEARQRGATIVHSPSDCMAAYENHPARKRAVDAPAAKNKPKDIEHWCSRIPSEEQAVYPIDQSDGGEDDDPAEHAEWAAKLKSMGRNPGMPWKSQSKLIEIDSDRDFISDRGDEVWNVLESRGIKNVILVGVHLNMCVLGRPFGLRQMVRNGKNVALMRDMTDCMYNPKRWPQVDHFTGNDLVIRHVERFVCPTTTSDQFLGGKPFRSKYDQRMKLDNEPATTNAAANLETFQNEWTSVSLPADWTTMTNGVLNEYEGVAWFRCTVRIPTDWLGQDQTLTAWFSHRPGPVQLWMNGQQFEDRSFSIGAGGGAIPRQAVQLDDINWLVFRVDFRKGTKGFDQAPRLSGNAAKNNLNLKGRWQFRLGDDKSWSNIPLPAKFGGSTDMLFEPKASDRSP